MSPGGCPREVYDAVMGLDGVELVMELESRFDVRLSDPVIGEARTVRQLADLIFSKLPNEQQALPNQRQVVLDEVRRLTAQQLGLRLDKVRPESDFVRDLRIDC